MEKVEVFPWWNECLTNPFGTLLLFQQPQRPKLAAPSVGHLGMIPRLIDFSGSACFPEDSSPGKRVAPSEVAYDERVYGQALEKKKKKLPTSTWLS